MAEPSNGSGCISIILQIFATLVSILFFAEASGTMESSPPPDISVEIELAPIEGAVYDDAILLAAANIVDQRLVNLGIIDYEVVITDEDTIITRMDAAIELDLILSTLQSTGLLEFVDFSGLREQTSDYEGAIILTTGQIGLFGESGITGNGGALHPFTDEPFVTVLTSIDIQNARSQYDENFGNYLVEVNFTDEGSVILGDYTEANIGEPLAIVLDGEVLTAPIVQTRLDSAAIITGNFTEEETIALAVQLNSEVLPVPLEIRRTISLD